MAITVYRDYDVLPCQNKDSGLECVARVETDDLEVAWLMTENEPMARVSAEHIAGGPVAITRFVRTRSNSVGDIFLHHTPDGTVPYRVASIGFERLTPQEWQDRLAGKLDAETLWLKARRRPHA